MIYTFRITLQGLKGFYRIYKINGCNSLYHFHKQLQSDLEFAQDQPVLFKALNAKEGVVARYALIDLGHGTIDDVTVEQALKAGATHFWYFHDTVAKKFVIVTLEGEPEAGVLDGPTLMPDTKGPLPEAFEKGYVAFEDLPDDKKPGHHASFHSDDPDDEDFEEDDEAEESSDDEDEEEIIYDSND